MQGSENLVADQLSRLHIPGIRDINDTFFYKLLLVISTSTTWFVDIVNFLVTRSILEY